MRDQNKLIITGNLGKDAEHIPGDNERVKFSVAVNEGYKDKDGNNVNKVLWIPVVFWKRSQKFADMFVKGRKVLIEGRLSVREYDVDGVKKTAVELIGQEFVLLSRDENSQGGGGSMVHNLEEAVGVMDEPSDDLPF